MALSIAIIGLPNVGKSTTFNALVQAQQAAAENYPFCTIEPNRAIVPVVDERVDQLVRLTGVPTTIYTTIEFVDIAGLVRGASHGEGLGNQFLGHIRDSDAIIHVVRCFDDENIAYISEHPQPVIDVEIVITELILADLQQLERKIERLTTQVKGDRKAIPVLEMAGHLQDHLERGLPASAFPNQDNEAFLTLIHDLRPLSAKPVIYAANVDEDGLAEDNDYVSELRQMAAREQSQVIKICAQLEADMAGMSRADRHEFLEMAGATVSGLDQIIDHGYQILGLISFFTMNEEQVRAWTVRQGSTAPQAAGTIHTDFEKGFIRAEVVAYDTFVHYGSWQATRAAGALRIEGKEYVVKDGDIIYFRFNV
jgi:GTP-binding protein YchF